MVLMKKFFKNKKRIPTEIVVTKQTEKNFEEV